MAFSTTPLRLSRAAVSFFLLATAVAVVAALPSFREIRSPVECRHARARFLGCRHFPPSRTPVPKPNVAGLTAAKAKLTTSLQKTGIVPQAYSGGSWQCGHSSGKGKGCGWATAKFLGKVITKCAECGVALFGSDSDGDGTNEVILQPPVYDKPVTIEGDTSKCKKCSKQVSDAPKCGGKVLGIGSKRKGRSCKLVKAAGCWPKGSDRVLHDCGPGAECKFKVTPAKAKIWCCRPYTKKFFKRWRNLFRCSSQALSKSKDRDGAVVMWE